MQNTLAMNLLPSDTYATNFFHYLSMLFLTIMLGTYVLAYKMVSIFGYSISGGIFIFPINYSIADVTTEIYGFEQTKKLIKLSFVCCMFFGLVVPFIAIMPSPLDWPHQPGYTYVLGNVFRFFLANTIGIIVGISINGFFVEKWKVLMNGKRFWLRSITASSIGEIITSIIADVLAFFGTTSMEGVWKIMLGILSVKLIYSILLAVPTTLLVTHLKLKTGILSEDNFNSYRQNKLRNKNAFIN